MIKEITARILNKKAVGLIALATLLFVLLAVSLKPSIARADQTISCASGFIVINPDDPINDQVCLKEDDYKGYCSFFYGDSTIQDLYLGCIETGENYPQYCRHGDSWGSICIESVVHYLVYNYFPTKDNPCGAYPFNSPSRLACIAQAENNINEADITYCGKKDNAVGVSIDVGCTGDENPILAYVGGAINFLSVGVGVVVVAMIVTGGVQYITSRGVPQQIEAAKKRITNALIALIMFIFLYAFLQWLIPGQGLFG